MKSLSSFLKKEASVSAKTLVKTTVNELKKASFASDMVTRLVAMLTVLRGLNKIEEVHLAGLLILSRFGAKGKPVPAEVVSFMPTTAPASKPEPQPIATIKVAPVANASPAKPATAVQKIPVQPVKKVSATAPARTLSNNGGGGVMATAMGKAASQLGLGPLAAFRKFIVGDGRGHNWTALHEATTAVLGQKLLEPADWKLLVVVLKTSIFFTDEESLAAFVAQCPREQMLDLLFGGEKNLRTTLQAIREEDKANGLAPLYVNFIIEVCMSVGKDAKDVLIGAKQAVNRMKQKGFIKMDHWLARKVSRMNASSTPLPAAKFASPEVIQREKQEASVATQPVVITTLVAAELKPQQETVNKGNKPDTEDLGSDFARTMLSGEQQAPPMPEHEGSDVEPAITAKPIFTLNLGTAEPVSEGQAINGKLNDPPPAETPNPGADTATTQ